MLSENQRLKLSRVNREITKKEILKKYNKTYKFNLILLKELKENKMTGWEMTKHIPHPLIFELGHTTLFYEHNILRYIRNKNGSILEHAYEMFDSLTNIPLDRIKSKIIDFNKQQEYYEKIYCELFNYLNNCDDTLSYFDTYIFMIGYLHNIMHQEVYLFLLHLLNRPCPLNYSVSIVEEITPCNPNNKGGVRGVPANVWIFIPGGTFNVGLNINDRFVVWDNERPKHNTIVNDFFCMKYPTTNKEYLDFIETGGYEEKKYWSYQGWSWRENIHKKNHPFFWERINDKWYRKHFDKLIELNMHEPVVHVSYYEAEAFANFNNARLPTEDEYTYLCTNGGLTSYPWGNDNKDLHKYCNINFSNNDVVPVNKYENGKNIWNVYDLYGNNWYWTITQFYPYDKFEIDPIYDTFSYPFFYFRIIVKGCSWASTSDLVHSNYRNAQEKEKVFHFTGIRLVKNINT